MYIHIKHINLINCVKCVYTSQTPSDQGFMQEDLKVIGTWSKIWKLYFSCIKSATLHFWQIQDNHTTYTLKNNPITSKNCIQRLIMSNLSWADHCDMETLKTYKSLGLIQCMHGSQFHFIVEYISWYMPSYSSVIKFGDPIDSLLLVRVQCRSTKHDCICIKVNKNYTGGFHYGLS